MALHAKRPSCLRPGIQVRLRRRYTEEAALEKICAAARGEPQLFEWRARHKSGRLFWVEVSLGKTTIGGKHFLLGTVRDISERKLAEEQSQLTQFIVDHGSEAIHVIDQDGTARLRERRFL